MDKIPNWLRWIGLIPISLLAALLVTFPLHWVLFTTLSSGDSPLVTPYPELPEKILSPFFSALALVWVSFRTAPSHKFITAASFASILIFVAGAGFAMAYFNISIGSKVLYLEAGGFPIIMGIIGSFIALYIVRTQNK